MATYSDNFNRANSSTLGSPWTDLSGADQLGIFSNQADISGVINDVFDYYNNTTANDQFTRAKFVMPSGSTEWSLMVRLTGTTRANMNAYVWYIQSGGTALSLQKFVSGTPSTLSTGSCSLSNGDIIEMRAVGNVLTLWQNSSQIATYTDSSSPLTTGLTGIGGYCVINSLNFDDWEGGDVSSGISVNLTGSSASFSAGSLTTSRTLSLSGSAVAGATGTLAPARAVPISGSLIASTTGSLTPSSAISLAGTVGTFSTGTISVSVAIPLTGQPGTFAAGTITYSAGGDITVSLTGQAATFSTGTLSPSISVPLVGQPAVFAAGTLDPAFSVSIAGSAGTFSTGTIGSSRTIALQAALAYFSSGTITPTGGTPVPGSGEAISARFIYNAGTLMVRK